MAVVFFSALTGIVRQQYFVVVGQCILSFRDAVIYLKHFFFHKFTVVKLNLKTVGPSFFGFPNDKTQKK